MCNLAIFKRSPDGDFRCLLFLSSMNKRTFGLLLLVFSALAILIAISDRAPIHLEHLHPSVGFTENTLLYFEGIADGSLPGPYAYRVLVPYMILGIHHIFPDASIISIDYILKIILLAACQFIFYFYLRLFFAPITSFAGVLMLDVLVAFTLSSIMGPSIAETSDLVNLIVFSLAFMTIYENKFTPLVAILFIGSFNRETTLLILPLFILNDYLSKRNAYRGLIVAAAVVVPYFALRIIIQTSMPQWFTFDGLSRNIPFLSSKDTMKAIMANIHVAVLLVPLLILSFHRFMDRPLFLRTAMIVTPFFIPIHYIFGTIIETRLWMPLFVVLIPLTLSTLVVYFDADSAKVRTSQNTVVAHTENMNKDESPSITVSTVKKKK